jgi:rhodanese-related sulfurtransferase
MAEGAKPNVWHTKEGFMQPKTAAQLVQEAKQRVENLSAERVAAELGQGDTLLIDLREPDEQAQHGMILGAISAPRGMLEFWADPTSPYHRQEFDPQRRIILHCASGGRSALAADTLQQLGYSNVAHLAGGLKAWAEEGRPVTKHEPEAQR